MERRTFIKGSVLATAAVAGVNAAVAGAREAHKEVYEFRLYHMNRNLAPLDDYLSKVLIPALNRLGVSRVGVFRETSMSEPHKVYTVMVYPSMAEYARIKLAVRQDESLATASRSYNEIPASRPVYERFDSSLLLAFDDVPQMQLPAKDQRLFELRVYEGHNEDAVRRKVKMFNVGELDIFRKVNIQPVFFGENLVGKAMPCLTYMAVYKDMAERDKAWKTFLDHPEWKSLSQQPEYADTVSRIHRVFLQPTPYSQI